MFFSLLPQSIRDVPYKPRNRSILPRRRSARGPGAQGQSPRTWNMARAALCEAQPRPPHPCLTHHITLCPHRLIQPKRPSPPWEAHLTSTESLTRGILLSLYKASSTRAASVGGPFVLVFRRPSSSQSRFEVSRSLCLSFLLHCTQKAATSNSSGSEEGCLKPWRRER